MKWLVGLCGLGLLLVGGCAVEPGYVGYGGGVYGEYPDVYLGSGFGYGYDYPYYDYAYPYPVYPYYHSYHHGLRPYDRDDFSEHGGFHGERHGFTGGFHGGRAGFPHGTGGAHAMGGGHGVGGGHRGHNR